MEYFDNPIIIGILAFVSIVGVSHQIISMFLGRHSTEQKRWHPNDETPLSHFISKQDLRKLQFSICILILLCGGFMMTLMGSYGNLPVVVALALIGFILPRSYYEMKARQRSNEFDANMMDFVMLVVNSLKSGFSMADSIAMSSRNVEGSIQEEFNRAMGEHNLGMGLDEALNRINQRSDSENLKLFTATVTVTLRTGGKASVILDNLVKTIQLRKAFQDKLRVKVANSKYQGMIMTFIPPLLILVLFVFQIRLKLLGDIATPLLNDPIGRFALGVGVVLLIIGHLSIKRICKIDA